MFLDDLVAQGREAEAGRYQPRERAAVQAVPVYGRDDAGRFVLQPDVDGDVWDPEWPVFLVDWFGAVAFAAWRAEATGRPWRLLGELEWEKAARGVDGRSFPWGDHLDPSWACLRESRAGRLLPAVVDGWPVDTSVYGVRGLGGNVADWCADVFRREGPQVEGARLPSSYPWAPDAQLGRVTRGGDWVSAMRAARSAYRGAHLPSSRFGALGFRVAYAPAP